MSAADAILREYGIKLPEGAIVHGSGEEIASLPAAQAVQQVLHEDLRALFEPALEKAAASKLPMNILSVLPRELPSTKTGQTPTPALVQIISTRDATQPLRACGDLFEGEVPAGMTCTRNSTTRLLRLVVSDGITELPAVETSTLSMFARRLPIPGEKLLLRGAAVKNGMIVLDESTCKHIGGSAHVLSEEYKMLTQQLTMAKHCASEAPKFASLLAKVSNPGAAAAAGAHHHHHHHQHHQHQHQQKHHQPHGNKQQHQRHHHQDPNAAHASHHHQHQKQGGGGGGDHGDRGGSGRGGRGGHSGGGGGGRGRGGGGGDVQQQQQNLPPAPRSQNRGGGGGGGGHHHHHHHHHHHRGGGGGGGGRGGGGHHHHHHHGHHHGHHAHHHHYQQNQHAGRSGDGDAIAKAQAQCNTGLDAWGLQ